MAQHRSWQQEPDEVRQYGDHADQFLRFYFPKKKKLPPVIVIVHGGFWKTKFTVDNAAIECIAPYLVDRGYAAVEVEYRRGEGSWPLSSEDVASALKVVAEDPWIDKKNIIVLGHSAGGHAAIVAAETTLLARLTVAIAPVADLVQAYDRRLSDEGDAIEIFLGGKTPTSDPELYHRASPALSMLPLKTTTLVVTGANDADVPPDLTRDFNKRILAAALEDDRHVFMELPVADHYSIVDARGVFFPYVFTAIKETLYKLDLPLDYNITTD